MQNLEFRIFNSTEFGKQIKLQHKLNRLTFISIMQYFTVNIIVLIATTSCTIAIFQVWFNPPIDPTIVDNKMILNVNILISIRYNININGVAFCTVINLLAPELFF